MKPCLTGETGPPSSPSVNGLKFKIKRTSTDDGKMSNNHVATQILPPANSQTSNSHFSSDNR